MTADDFGADPAVNEAVELGHRRGILTAASLMVAGRAMDDAVARARTMPRLGVGLHLVLVDGRPVLPRAQIPDLVGADGAFRKDMVRVSFGFALVPRIRRQLADEIDAQFAAFAATGLSLDHANAHKHFHLHPVIGGLMLEIGARYGLRAVRTPVEPHGVLAAIEPVRGTVSGRVAGAYARVVRRRAGRAGMVVPDAVFGLAWSGAMMRERVAGLAARLPPGLNELYVHPATRGGWEGSAAGYRYRDELVALTDPGIAAILRDRGVTLGSFAQFGAA